MLLIWAGAQLLMIILFIPETYHPVVLRRKAIRKRRETGDDRWKAPIEWLDRSITQTVIRSCYRPFLLLTLEPMCLNLCIFSALLLGVLYLWFGAFELVFQNNHDFELWQVGMTYVRNFKWLSFSLCSMSNDFKVRMRTNIGSWTDKADCRWNRLASLSGY